MGLFFLEVVFFGLVGWVLGFWGVLCLFLFWVLGRWGWGFDFGSSGSRLRGLDYAHCLGFQVRFKIAGNIVF